MNPRARLPKRWFSDAKLLPPPDRPLASYMAIDANRRGVDGHGPVAFDPEEVLDDG